MTDITDRLAAREEYEKRHEHWNHANTVDPDDPYAAGWMFCAYSADAALDEAYAVIERLVGERDELKAQRPYVMQSTQSWDSRLIQRAEQAEADLLKANSDAEYWMEHADLSSEERFIKVEAEVERLRKGITDHHFVDATPDAGFVRRILESYIDESYWSDNTAGVPARTPVVVMMNDWRKQRNRLLRDALARLEEGEP